MKTIILLHGLRGDHHGLEELAKLLEKKGYKVINPDLPGYGGAANLCKKTLDSYSVWLHEQIEDLKTEPYIVAHSMGSIIASHYLAKYPTETQQKVVFVSPIFRTEFSQKSSNIRSALTRGALHLLPPKPRLGLMRSKLTSFCISHYLTYDRAQSKKIDEMHYKYSCNFNSSRALMEDIKISMNEQTVPVEQKDVLYIIGNKDRLTKAELAKSRAKEQGAKFIAIPETGHLINYEKPAELAKVIDAFLR